LNKIQPGTVKRINKRDIPLMQLENIKLYLEGIFLFLLFLLASFKHNVKCCSAFFSLAGCWKLGVPSGSLFSSSDLYKEKDMTSVLQNLQALGRLAQTLDAYDGPQYGQAVSKSNVRKHKAVDTAYLTKKFVQSGETADTQVSLFSLFPNNAEENSLNTTKRQCVPRL
jgi:hypothetical protein